ncbi:MAG: lipocalin/fatty-acid binding family protein [Gammaproteobacteria bacterium]|nr:lipocalin/fatty-acid binding family protein [Gammaproteobacteria bacterium]
MAYGSKMRGMLHVLGTSVVKNTADLFGLEMQPSEELLEAHHAPKAREEIYRANVAGVKTNELNGLVKRALTSSKTHLADLTPGKTGFEDQISELRAHIAANPADMAAAGRVAPLTAIERDLLPSRVPSFEINQFEERLAVLHELLERKDVDDPRVIIAYIKEQYAKLSQELDSKKTSDLALIDAKIADIRAGNLLSEDATVALEKSLKDRVNEAHDKAKKGLETDFKQGVPAAKEGEKATPSLFADFDKAAQKAEAELFSFVMYAEIIKTKAAVDPSLTAGVGPGLAPDDPKRYRNIKFEDYIQAQAERSHDLFSAKAWSQYFSYLLNQKAELETTSGLRMKIDPGSGSVSMTFPSNSIFSSYYSLDESYLEDDMMMLVNEIVRQGKDTISLSVESDDPKIRAKVMEAFYVAAKLAEPPFDDSKIKFSATITEEQKNSFQDKTATEIMGQLGSAPSRVAAKRQKWNAEKESIKKESNQQQLRDMASLDRKIEDILDHRRHLHAAAGPAVGGP